MIQTSVNILRLEQIAAALGELKEQVVFVGGAIVEFYLPPGSKHFVRPTKDVDCIVEARTRGEHAKFEASLREHGFTDAAMTIPGSPICRWVYNDIVVDFMPSDESILGFSNRWYYEAFKEQELYQLPSGTEISICSLPYFLATKLEAFYDRGKADPRTSTDLEDIVTLLDGVSEINSRLGNGPASVKTYLKERLLELSDEQKYGEAIECNSVLGFEQAERVKRLVQHLSKAL